MKLGVTLDILNQKATPAFYADTLANRPAAGYTGRVFISTDTYDLYRDTGTTWVLLSPSSTGTITGSGAAGQVTYFSGASSITGDNNLFWDSVNSHLGIKTITPDCALDVNHNGTFVAKFNNTTTANTLIGFYNLDNPQWLIGSNSVANNLTFYDATNFPTLTATTTMATDGTTYIGGQTTGSGRLNVYSATSDNGIQISGANAPSLRIDNAPTGATKRIGLGISTATNNFIQGSADRDMAIFNGSTTPSPILFGIYGTTNIQEAARISAARNLIVGKVTDSGQRLQINGKGYINDTLILDGTNTNQYLNFYNSGVDRAHIYWQESLNNLSIGTYVAGGSIQFEVGNNVDAMFLSSSGNLGLGVTPSAWSIYRAFQLGTGIAVGGLIGRTDGLNEINFGLNWTYTGGASLTYIASSFATNYYQKEGAHIWQTAPSGTSGNAITFSTPMTLTASSNLLLGTSVDNGNKLQVNGNTSLTGQLSTIQSISTDYIATFQNTNANSYGVIIKSAASPNNAYPLLAVTNSAGSVPYLRVDSGTGNVSIGTNPGANSSLRIAGLPTSPVGLASGEVWNNLGVLSIV